LSNHILWNLTKFKAYVELAIYLESSILVLYQWSYSLLEIVLMSLKSTFSTFKVVLNKKKNVFILKKNKKILHLIFYLKKKKKKKGLKCTFEKGLKRNLVLKSSFLL
jgi:hypothetical protein